MSIREKLIDALCAELGDTYDCKRVWSAWSYGTMGEDDFVPVSERVDEIADGILAALGLEQHVLLPDGLRDHDGEIQFQCIVCERWTEWPADVADFVPDASENVCGGSPRCCP